MHLKTDQQQQGNLKNFCFLLVKPGGLVGRQWCQVENAIVLFFS